MNPLVSIIIPTYNGERFLSEALASAAAQTYDNMEIVVSDDRSTDRTLDIAREFAASSRHPVRMIDHTPQGMVSNWNDTVRTAQGTYIKFLFQDDILEPHCVQKMVALAESDSEIGLVFSPRRFIVDTGMESDTHVKLMQARYAMLHQGWNSIKSVQAGVDLLRDRNFLEEPINKVGEPTVVLVRKSLFEKAGYFDPDLKQLVDWEMWVRIMAVCRVGFIDEPLMSFRLHQKQMTQQNRGAGELDLDLHRYYDKLFHGPVFGNLAPSVRERLMDRYAAVAEELGRKQAESKGKIEVRATHVENCWLCGAKGKMLHNDVQDRLWSAPGKWNLIACSNVECGMVWIDPMPAEDELGKLYTSFYTHRVQPQHAKGDKWSRFKASVGDGIINRGYGYHRNGGGKLEKLGRAVGGVLGLLPQVRDFAGAGVYWLPYIPNGRVLDIGCGNGEMLSHLQNLGWQVMGVEPDAVGTHVAREHFKIDVRNATIEAAHLPDATFDFVTMHHVIEHLPDVTRTLKEIHRILKPGGKLMVATPNTASRGRRKFQDAWLNWDPPRHLYLFSPKNLPTAIERAGFHVIKQWTSARMAGWLLALSEKIRNEGSAPGARAPWPPGFALTMRKLRYQGIQAALCPMAQWGEELIMIAQKRD